MEKFDKKALLRAIANRKPPKPILRDVLVAGKTFKNVPTFGTDDFIRFSFNTSDRLATLYYENKDKETIEYTEKG